MAASLPAPRPPLRYPLRPPHLALGRLAIGFFLVASVAFGLRLLGTGELRSSPDPISTPSADAHYYLKRTVDTWRHWPALPQREPGLRCPTGTYPPWPHGLNLLGAGSARLLLGAEASAAQVERLTAWLPPVLGALAAGLLFLFAASVLGFRAGIGAGLVVAALPIVVWNSAWGVVDHHVFAGIFPLASVAGLWAGWRRAQGLRSPLSLLRDPFALSGAVVGLGYGFWTELWIHQLVLLAVALVWATCGGFVASDRRRLLGGIARASLATALFSLPGILTAPYTVAGWVAPHAPSRFSLWIVLALAISSLAAWGSAHNKTPGAWPSLGAAFAAGLATLGLAIWIDPGMRGAVLAIFSFAGHGGVVGVIDESRPLLTRPFPQPLLLLSAAIVLSPVLPLVWRDRPRPLRVLLSLWFWGTLPLALLQTRFALVFALPFSLGLGALIADGLPAGLLSAGRARVLRWVAVVLMATGPVALAGHRYWTVDHESRDRLMRWLHDELPYHASAEGPRCTLAPWDLGHELLRVAGRPVVAHPFTEFRDREGIVTLARFLTAPSPEAALAAMAPVEPVDLVWISGMDLDDLRSCFEEVGRPIPPPAGLLATTWARLWLANGAAVKVAGVGGGASLQGYGSLRRIRTSPLVVSQALPGLIERPVHRDKIYQRVRGARIEGQAPAGAEVWATTQVVHPGAPPFDFAQFTRADARGHFSLRVPYAGSGMPLGLRASPRYQIAVDGHPRFEARVEEQDVTLGRAVTVTAIDRSPR